MMDSYCRLCGCNSPDLVSIYTIQGKATSYVSKINRYLYLLVTPEDQLPKVICWMCSQQLDSFHIFHTKINEIQQKLLKDCYMKYVIEINGKRNDTHDALGEYLPVESEHDGKAKDEYATIQLIPSHKADDSFLVVKTESSANLTNFDKQSRQMSTLQKDKTESLVEVFEIRKSTRRNIVSRNRKTKYQKENQMESGDENHVKHKSFNVKYPENLRNVTESKFLQQDNDESLISASSTNATKLPASKALETYVQSNQTKVANHTAEEMSEGESENEFPARDSDNEEWPAAETMEKFPTKIIQDGLLTVKGKELMQMINNFYNLLCDICEGRPKRFKTFPDLFSHQKTIHNQEGHVLCCQTKFFRYPAIIMHMARHIQPEAFKCDICGYMVTRPRFLISHRQTHLPEDQKPYACNHCPKRFCWKRALHVHLNLHKTPEERVVYECLACKKTYDTPGGLSAHKKNVHVNPQAPRVSHVCEICANRFATSSGLKEHMLTIHQPREKGLMQCPECFKWLMNSRCLKVHMQLHSKEDLHCGQCNYLTKKQSLLRRHMITHHQEERPFYCEKCGSTFKHKRALTVHIGIKHGIEKHNYKCNFCDRTFASSTNFYTHRKNRHPDELASMKEHKEQEKKLQRIKAGVEPDDIPSSKESTITTAADGTRIITISSREYGLQEPMDEMIVLDATDYT
ncbi:zinc finger protein 675-like [Wyeomyia smithii]|uniref:zinc finger protein 675-like n=1 Tax=Wyeomyia smithii TaxID=174621 RepID=UPI002467CEC9|nr:zinc finger protein 675-like [Wyeomyia smithii]